MANPTDEVRSNDGASEAKAGKVDMKFEAVVIPVSNVDRAKAFYGSLGGGWTRTSPSITASGSSNSRRRARLARVLEPLAEFVAGRSLFQPEIDPGPLFAEASWPETIY
jgi:hypothetical protein